MSDRSGITELQVILHCRSFRSFCVRSTEGTENGWGYSCDEGKL